MLKPYHIYGCQGCSPLSLALCVLLDLLECKIAFQEVVLGNPHLPALVFKGKQDPSQICW